MSETDPPRLPPHVASRHFGQPSRHGYDRHSSPSPVEISRHKQILTKWGALAGVAALGISGLYLAPQVGRLIGQTQQEETPQHAPSTYSLEPFVYKGSQTQPVLMSEFPTGQQPDPETRITWDDLAKQDVDTSKIEGSLVDGPDYLFLTQTDGSLVFEPKRQIHNHWFRFKEPIMIERNGELKEVQPLVPAGFVKENRLQGEHGFSSTPPGVPPLSGKI